uniref:tRNA (adenine(58)-N(1))-methyltransferase non-catalytic subunit TRM6 n=1 Tax=Heterorhabditis bacteriophora TaxID=37862 RepID=A0A1I7WKZ4_HETBA
MNKTALSKMVTKDSYVIVQKIDELRPESSPTENETCNNQESVQNSKVESTINPAQALQKLTQNDVLGLKSQGVTTGELVAKLVEGNISFNSRTDYAKRKYIRRKTKKHSDRVLIIKPTIRLILVLKIFCFLLNLIIFRIDQLGLILQLAGIHYGKRAVVFDQKCLLLFIYKI